MLSNTLYGPFSLFCLMSDVNKGLSEIMDSFRLASNTDKRLFEVKVIQDQPDSNPDSRSVHCYMKDVEGYIKLSYNDSNRSLGVTYISNKSDNYERGLHNLVISHLKSKIHMTPDEELDKACHGHWKNYSVDPESILKYAKKHIYV